MPCTIGLSRLNNKKDGSPAAVAASQFWLESYPQEVHMQRVKKNKKKKTLRFSAIIMGAS